MYALFTLSFRCAERLCAVACDANHHLATISHFCSLSFRRRLCTRTVTTWPLIVHHYLTPPYQTATLHGQKPSELVRICSSIE